MEQISEISRLRTIAWIPDNDPKRPWPEAAGVALSWIWQQSVKEGKEPLLVTYSSQNITGITELENFVSTDRHVTLGGKARPPHAPVLAYVPDERTLGLAIEQASGYSLVIVESKNSPMTDWASRIGAINLLDDGADS